MEHGNHGETSGLMRRGLSRRRVLWGSLLLTVGPVAAACQSNLPQQAATAGAQPTKPAAAPTSAPAAPATKPAAAATAPAAGAATKPAAAATTAPAAAATKPAGAAAKPAPTATVQPTAIAGIQRAKSNAKITGKFGVLVNQDFHPDHNLFMRAEYTEYAKVNGWDLDLSNVAGFQGGGDLKQKLVASVQAGNAPDLFNHNIGARQLQFLGVLEPVSDLVQENIGKHGDPVPGFRSDLEFDNNWWAVPFFTRGGGYYARKDIFQKHGLDVEKDTEDYNKVREAALKISDPDNKLWGWGMTINRSGDGNGMVQNLIFGHGGQLQDESGEIIKFDSPETIKALDWLKETYTDPKWAKMLPPGVNSWNDLSNNEAFLAGQIAITQNAGTMLAKAYFDKVPHAKDIVALRTPVRFSDRQRIDALSGERFYVTKGAKNKEAAYDMIRHMTSEPVQQQVWRISTAYALPAYKKGWSHDIITSVENSKRAEKQAFPEGALNFTGLRWPGPATPAVDAIAGANYFTDMMAEVLQGKPTAEVVKDYHKRFVQIFKEFGLKGA